MGAVVLSLLFSATAPSDVPFTRVVVDANNPAEPWCKAVGDINGDRLPDILIASAADGGLWWYEAPNWTKHAIRATGSWGTDLQTGDVDNDGDLDVIAPGMVWYENPRPAGDPRTATWVQHTIGVVGPNDSHDVEVADIDGDGKLDVVIRPEVGSGTYVFFQDTSDSWTKVTVGTRSGEGTNIADIDNDGDLDIAINGYWLENPGPTVARTAAWTEHTVNATWPLQVGVLVVDLNADGRKDIVLAPAESASGRLAWYEATNPKTGPWTEHVIDPTVAYMHTFKAGDVDLDGRIDLVTAEMHQAAYPREVSVYYNLGAGLTWHQQVLADTGSHNIRLIDIGRDGDLDIVGANWSDAAPDSAVITLWQNELNPGLAPEDLDGDGDVDLTDLALLTGCRTGPAVPYNPAALPPTCGFLPDALSHIPADLNGDGVVDQEDFALLQRCYAGSGIRVAVACAN